MGITELVDKSAAIALTHALALQRHLKVVSPADLDVSECSAEVHRLVADIVSLRNAAELLKRELARVS